MTTKPDKSIATLSIPNADKLTLAEARRIAEWLSNTGAWIVREYPELARGFRSRLFSKPILTKSGRRRLSWAVRTPQPRRA